MASRVSERGQITIDPALRKYLGIQPGMVAYQRVILGRLEVIFLPGPHRQSLSGALARDGEKPVVLTRDEIEQAVEQAIAEEEGTCDGD